jgi:hypothetical protein
MQVLTDVTFFEILYPCSWVHITIHMGKVPKNKPELESQVWLFMQYSSYFQLYKSTVLCSTSAKEIQIFLWSSFSVKVNLLDFNWIGQPYYIGFLNCEIDYIQFYFWCWKFRGDNVKHTDPWIMVNYDRFLQRNYKHDTNTH